MSDYRTLYNSTRRDNCPLKNDHYVPRGYTSRTQTSTDRSYQVYFSLIISINLFKDLKDEYSKVLNYVDSIRHDQGYCKVNNRKGVYRLNI